MFFIGPLTRDGCSEGGLGAPAKQACSQEPGGLEAERESRGRETEGGKTRVGGRERGWGRGERGWERRGVVREDDGNRKPLAGAVRSHL